jgi:tetratricopeptide (TPR) repeat protein
MRLRERIAELLVGGRISQAVALFESRRNELMRKPMVVVIVRDLLAGLNAARQPELALKLGNTLIADSQPRKAAKGSKRAIPTNWLAGSAGAIVFNELGNSARHLADYDTALAYYQRAAGCFVDDESPNDSDMFVVIRNTAIVLRALRRTAEARDLLLDLLDHSLEPGERAQALNSLAGCEILLGEYERAEAVVDEALDIQPIPAINRMELLVTAAQVALSLKDLARSRTCAAEAAVIATGLDDLRAAAVTVMISAVAAIEHHDDHAAELAQQAEEAIEALEDFDASVVEERLDIAAMRSQLWSTLDKFGLLDDADKLVGLATEPGGDSWEVLTNAALVLIDREEFSRAGALLTQAWSRLLPQLASDAIEFNDFLVLRNAEALQTATAEVALAAVSEDPTDARQLLRAAELSSSLAGALLTWPIEQRAEAAALIEGTEHLESLPPRTVLLTSLATSTDVHVLVSDGLACTTIGQVSHDQLATVAAEVGAVTRRSPPYGNPLTASAAWTEWARELGQALQPHVRDAELIAIVAQGKLAHLPLHVIPIDGQALCLQRPFCYVGSLVQLAGLQTRPGADTAIEWVGVVSVPRAKDSAWATDAFGQGAAAFTKLATTHRLKPTPLTGTHATRDTVTEALGFVDLMFLSCHGVSEPGFGRHGLLLASDGQLPPGILASGHEDGFLLSWDEIAEPTPLVVVSGACSSVSASIVKGHEKVSLDRSFLTAGTQLYFGPQWDVAIDESQTVCVALVERYLNGARSWAHAWHQALLGLEPTVAPATWMSFTPIGNWRAACPR